MEANRVIKDASNLLGMIRVCRAMVEIGRPKEAVQYLVRMAELLIALRDEAGRVTIEERDPADWWKFTQSGDN